MGSTGSSGGSVGSTGSPGSGSVTATGSSGRGGRTTVELSSCTGAGGGAATGVGAGSRHRGGRCDGGRCHRLGLRLGLDGGLGLRPLPPGLGRGRRGRRCGERDVGHLGGHDRVGGHGLTLAHVLDLHGARGDDQGGRHARSGLRGERADAGRDCPAGGDPAGRRGCGARHAGGGESGAGASAGGRGATGHAGHADLRDPELLQDQERGDAVDGGQRPVGGAELALEGSAAVTALQMTAHRGR